MAMGVIPRWKCIDTAIFPRARPSGSRIVPCGLPKSGSFVPGGLSANVDVDENSSRARPIGAQVRDRNHGHSPDSQRIGREV